MAKNGIRIMSEVYWLFLRIFEIINTLVWVEPNRCLKEKKVKLTHIYHFNYEREKFLDEWDALVRAITTYIENQSSYGKNFCGRTRATT